MMDDRACLYVYVVVVVVPVIRWSMDKQYLLELQGAGLPVVPSVLVPMGMPKAKLVKLLAQCHRDWATQHAVLKVAC